MQSHTPEKPLHLLVVDDEEAICELVTDIAELNGFSTEAVYGIQHLDHLPLQPVPDVLVLDLSMPHIDGIEVIHHIAQLGISPQLILISGFEHSVIDGARKLAEHLNLPVLGLLSKPFSIRELEMLLQKPAANIRQQPAYIASHQRTVPSADIEPHMAKGLFVPYFQPQINMKTGALHGAEALVRWHHPSGMFMPDQFLPLIESQQLILPLTRTVIEQTMQQMLYWEQHGLKNMQVSINLSAAYLDQLNLPGLMSELLQSYPITSEQITFEITERLGLDNTNQPVLDTLTRLRLKGFFLSIDDFGTGYSSLAQLSQLPFNEIKIDKSFVFHMLTSPISGAIVKSSVELAQQLGVRCVAEGIETAELHNALCETGCDIGQGYLYSKALPSKDFLQWALKFKGAGIRMG